MKIALAQINTKVGDINANARKILDWTKKAGEAGAELAVFPEMTLTGYPPWDLLENKNFVNDSIKTLKELSKKITEPACLIGYVDRNPSKQGKRLFNCAALLHKGNILAKRSKTLLPTYDVFDEARYFESAVSNLPVNFKSAKLGITICEDIWNEKGLRPEAL